MDNCYAHAICISYFKVKDFKILEEIFKSGYILSRNEQRKQGKRNVSNSIITACFNGMDYISLCDLMMSHDGYSSYDMYIRKGLSLLLDRDLSVIKPKLIDQNDFMYFNTYTFCGKERFTDLIDEVQVKDQISLKHLLGISLSLSVFRSFHDEEYLINYLKYVNFIQDKYNYDVPIYNLDDKSLIKIKK